MKILIPVLLLLAGCATNKEYAAYLAAQQSIAVQHSEAQKAKFAAIQKGMETGGDTSKAVGMMALVMAQTPQVNVAAPPESEVMSFAKAVFPPLLMFGGVWVSADASKHAATMSRDVAMSTNQAFVGMGQQIAAGYPFIQAPGAVNTTNTTNTNTLSGTGVLGSGTYNPVTNTWTNSYNRNCTGGNGAGTTNGAPGGAANC